MIQNAIRKGFRNGNKDFSEIRPRLNKTQLQIAQLLSIILKTIQSLKQGWTNIPVHIERQVFFLCGF